MSAVAKGPKTRKYGASHETSVLCLLISSFGEPVGLELVGNQATCSYSVRFCAKDLCLVYRPRVSGGTRKGYAPWKGVVQSGHSDQEINT